MFCLSERHDKIDSSQVIIGIIYLQLLLRQPTTFFYIIIIIWTKIDDKKLKDLFIIILGFKTYFTNNFWNIIHKILFKIKKKTDENGDNMKIIIIKNG